MEKMTAKKGRHPLTDHSLSRRVMPLCSTTTTTSATKMTNANLDEKWNGGTTKRAATKLLEERASVPL